ncbi:hypothetical protein [Silvibacterium sp.]|uniref:hypothetical protein n=1 Tax=Silvibacterium sp. TaxID=1964179 RepID=UPI0039E2C908
MNREQIIAALDEEIARLQQVKKLLQSTSGRSIDGSGAAVKPASKRILSPEARQRIAAAQKRRWAKQKKETSASPAKK